MNGKWYPHAQVTPLVLPESQGGHPWYYQDLRKRRPRAVRVASVVAGTVLTAAVAFAATNWTVGLTGGSSGEAQAGTVSNLTISAVASPAATNLLFPGGNGDVVATITNPNAVAVTLTALSLPSSTTYATGYTASNLTGGSLDAPRPSVSTSPTSSGFTRPDQPAHPHHPAGDRRQLPPHRDVHERRQHDGSGAGSM